MMNMKVDSQRRRSLEALFQGYGRNSKYSVLLKGSLYLLESKMTEEQASGTSRTVKKRVFKGDRVFAHFHQSYGRNSKFSGILRSQGT